MSKTALVLYVTCIVLISACAANETSRSSIGKNHVISNKSANSIQFEQAFLAAVNKVRARARSCGSKKFAAAPALKLNAKLSLASYKHSLDMSQNQFLEHVSSNGDTLVERMQNVNYVWKAVGENLAHNQKTIQEVIDDWLASPGHCSNLMSYEYTQTGVAQVNGYWTQVYATPK